MRIRSVVRIAALIGTVAHIFVPTQLAASAAAEFRACWVSNMCTNNAYCVKDWPGFECVCFPNPVLGPMCYNVNGE